MDQQIDHEAQIITIKRLTAELEARAPHVLAIIRAAYEPCAHECCTHSLDGLIEELARELDALDDTEAQRTINRLADEHSTDLAAALTYYRGE